MSRVVFLMPFDLEISFMKKDNNLPNTRRMSNIERYDFFRMEIHNWHPLRAKTKRPIY